MCNCASVMKNRKIEMKRQLQNRCQEVGVKVKNQDALHLPRSLDKASEKIKHDTYPLRSDGKLCTPAVLAVLVKRSDVADLVVRSHPRSSVSLSSSLNLLDL